MLLVVEEKYRCLRSTASMTEQIRTGVWEDEARGGFTRFIYLIMSTNHRRITNQEKRS